MAIRVYHAPVSGTKPQLIWNSQRRLLGNLVPALFWLPPNIAGLFVIVRQSNPLGPGLGLLVLGLVVGWLSLNVFGFWDNTRMRGEMRAFLQKSGVDWSQGIFVGFSTPAHQGLVDAHEDVGYLLFRGDELLFLSETRTIRILRSQVTNARFRSNVHSLLGLGRWISIEGKLPTGPMRMLVEPREHTTLLANRQYGRELLAKIEAWRKGDPS